MGNRRKTAASTPSMNRGPSNSVGIAKNEVVQHHLNIPYFTIDTILVPLSYYVFLNIYTASIFWFLVTPVICILMFPFIVLVGCWGIGAMCVVLYRMRLRKSTKIDWKNEIVVITGGSHGLGKELASQIATAYKPRKIIVLDVTASIHDSPLIAYYECDISDRRKVKSIAESIVHDYGHPTILINNAGVVRGNSFLDLSEADIERTISINLLGQIWICKAFLPHMVEKDRGHIINVASVMGIIGAKYMTDYCASKFGSVGFSESLRQDLCETNVQVSTIYPGLIDTGMFFGVDHRFPRFTPPLHPKYVSDNIISILNSGRGQDLKLPFYSNLVTFLRIIPREFADMVREFTGANNDMKKFKYSLSGKRSE